MKKIIYLFFTVFLGISQIALAGNEAEISEAYGWNVVDEDNNTLTITYVKFSNTNTYEFKETYTHTEKDYTVTAIGDGTNSVVIPGTKNNDYASTAKSVVLPTTIINIGANALKTWTKLTSLTILADKAPELGADALPASLTKIVVPAGKAKEYATAEGWKTYASLIEDTEGEKAGNPTNVSETEKVSFSVAGRTVMFNQEVYFEIYGLTGAKEFAGKAASFTVKHKGIYIIKYGDEKKKVVLK